MKKRTQKILAGLLGLSLLLLAACTALPSGEETTAPTTTEAPKKTVLFDKDTMPRLDGSTANIPLAELLLKRVTEFSEEEIIKRVEFTTTPYSYVNLINNQADLLLVYEADESTKAELQTRGVELEYHPIGRDALVFLINSNNPVKNLTTKQLQDIYQGKITNWKPLGGEDKEIVAYQRVARSGSQALMEKLVMKDLEMMEAPTELAPGEMSGLVDAIASYQNTQNALGYSVYYYARNMYQQPGLAFLSVDGKAPSNDSIRDGSYPFTNDFYAVIRKSESENSPARQLLQWILSADGKRCVTDSGYVGVN